MKTNSTSTTRPIGRSDDTLRRLRRMRWPLWIQLAAVFFWTLGLPVTRAAYVPDSTGQPVWDGNGDEPADGPDYGNSDYDLLPNWYEDYLGTDKYNPDTDGDGVTDSDEVLILGTNPLQWDTDGNGWSDLEDFNGSSATNADPDNDGLTNARETNLATNPHVADTDGDGLKDGVEASSAGAFSPLNPDSDENGVGDYYDYYGIAPPSEGSDGDSAPEDSTSPPSATTDPYSLDTDGDGLSDGLEDELRNAGTFMSLSNDADTDDDGLSDGLEYQLGLDPANADTDGDGLDDMTEVAIGSKGNVADSDGDGLSDGFEYHTFGSSPTDADSDDDGASDAAENAAGTSPNNSDTDGDGLSDGEELSPTSTTNPLSPDSDGDGISDYEEVRGQPAPPPPPDSDGDGLNDAQEAVYGSDPQNPDTDGDGLYDGFEVAWGSYPSSADSDGDGVDDDVEYQCGLDPINADSDGDHLSDGAELTSADSATDPNEADSDGDGLSDDYEINLSHTDPNNPDTDGDYISDFEEINAADLFPGIQITLNPLKADSDDDGVRDYLEITGFLTDSDGGGIPDRIEALYQLDPNNPDDDTGNLDGDGTNNLEEYNAGQALNGDFVENYDTDADGMSDVWELAWGFDPINRNDAAGDPDGDWMTNLEEFRAGSNPFMYDSGISNPTPAGYYLNSGSDDWDQDGVSNLDEMLVTHTDPRVPNSTTDTTTTSTDTTTTSTDTTTTYMYTTTTAYMDWTTTFTDTTTTTGITDSMYSCTCGGNHASSADCGQNSNTTNNQSGGEDGSTCPANRS